MEDKINYTSVVDELLKAIPELKLSYDENSDMWLDDYLPYVVFGLVVIPTMEKLLQNERQSSILIKIFNFIELMLFSEDSDVQTLATVEIIEWLAFENNTIISENTMKLMGPKTSEKINNLRTLA